MWEIELNENASKTHDTLWKYTNQEKVYVGVHVENKQQNNIYSNIWSYHCSSGCFLKLPFFENYKPEDYPSQDIYKNN